jgi:hypothetical protein
VLDVAQYFHGATVDAAQQLAVVIKIVVQEAPVSFESQGTRETCEGPT